MSYIGRSPAYGALEHQFITGNGTTTSFNLNYSVANSASVMVTINGVFKNPVTQYGALDKTINFATAPANGAVVCIIFLGLTMDIPYNAGNDITRASYTANGTDTGFAIGQVPVSNNSILVFKSGLLQKITTDYTISGSNVVFVTPPAVSAVVQIYDIGAEKISIATPADGSITLEKLAPSVASMLTTIGEWNSISSNTTAVSGKWYMIDTSGGPVTLTLPASPGLYSSVRFLDVAGSFNTNNLTIARNGQKIMGVAQDMTIDSQNAANGLVYSGTTNGWRLMDL